MKHPTFNYLILDVTCQNQTSLRHGPVKESNIQVELYFYNRLRKRIATLTQQNRCLFNRAVSGYYLQGSNQLSTPHKYIKQKHLLCSLCISTTCPQYTYATLVITQRRPSLDIPFRHVQSFLSGSFTPLLPKIPSSSAVENKFEPHMIGTFTSNFKTTLKNERCYEITDVVVVFLKTIHPKTLRAAWAFHPLGEVLTLKELNTSCSNAKYIVDSITTRCLDSLMSSHFPQSNQIVYFDDFLASEEQSYPSHSFHIHNNSNNSITSHIPEENPCSFHNSISHNSLPSIQEGILHESESSSADLRTLFNRIRVSTFNLSNSLTQVTQSTDEKKILDPSQNNLNSNPNAMNDTTLQTAKALADLRRLLREDFLDTCGKEIQTKKESHPGSVDVPTLVRGIQLLQQRQEELENLLDSSLYIREKKNRVDFSSPRNPEQDLVTQCQNDGFVQEFIKFTRGLEQASQLTGSSFRRLQQVLHYPEEFESKTRSPMYPYARKLLEFVTSKQATRLVENIEVLAGLWRSAGGRVSSDAMTAGTFDLQETQRKPWWPSRPFY